MTGSAKQCSTRMMDCFVASLLAMMANAIYSVGWEGVTMAISQTEGGASTIDVAEFIDRQPVGGFQIRLLLTCAAVLFLDGFDTQAIGYVAPALAKEWDLTKGALGPVFSAGLFGLMIGALVFGPLTDRVGRKKIIILSTLAFGIGSLATAFV